MTKIIVKKNVKPRKKATQKQKQTQKQNVTVNIGTDVIKKRGRPKKAQQTKQTQITTIRTMVLTIPRTSPATRAKLPNRLDEAG